MSRSVELVGRGGELEGGLGPSKRPHPLCGSSRILAPLLPMQMLGDRTRRRQHAATRSRLPRDTRNDPSMHPSQVQPAVAAAVSVASALGLRADDAVVLHDSNRLALRLLPCDVLARVAHMEGKRGAEFEVEVARRLAETDSP